MKELKPCPFCGGRVNIIGSSRLKGFLVLHTTDAHERCFQFEIDWGEADSLQEAKEIWNRRVTDGMSNM